ncbi:branched-chain amino acid transport system II carrier protein [Schleiferilactobacillus shenzhenensis]|uniref:Branched-chain amino acid transport system carrier protein n=1 Tax=Schleiferilactobacillus shenzhenensis LY-73 TaxID=1231336 RepID=U4TLH3_9LACO|nr:branched-chain amino acid transport system II carrier protein [Schleiferilactobacillus shenzhenensis]ERL64245.1 BrnQ [Schleiferilactobacillus shenzhenensis LY-73]
MEQAHTRIRGRDLVFVGIMLFGMFFGAGNLIFPTFMGQQAGSHVGGAVIGFLLTGVGLPLLGVVAMGITRTAGVFSLASNVNRPFAYMFTVALYWVIGPLLSTPRLATVSFEVGVRRFVAPQQQTLFLAIFSVLFFAAVWFFARKPSRIMEYVGKILTPTFLVLLGVLMLTALLRPLGGLNHAAIGTYISHPLNTGFVEGYNTMDALASLAFGIVVIDTLRGLGVKEPKQIAANTIRAGVISMVLMGVIYAGLAIIGTQSRGAFPIAQNGGTILAELAEHYFGGMGSWLLAIIITLACLKTGVGLVTAFGETMHKLFPRFSYTVWAALAAGLPALFANVGLDGIIAISMPVLNLLYPLAMILILTALASVFLPAQRWTYTWAMMFGLIPAILNMLTGLPPTLQHWTVIPVLLHWGEMLPLYQAGFGWVLPAVLGFLVGAWVDHRHARRVA